MEPGVQQALQPSKLPKRLPVQALDQLENTKEFTSRSFSGCNFKGQSASELLFEQVHFRRVVFTRTRLGKMRLADMRAELYDCSGGR